MNKLGFLGLVALFCVDAQAQDRGADRGTQRARPANQANQAKGQGEAWKLLASKYDKNEDGKISLDEYPRGETKFKSFDRDGDGAITAKDFASGGNRQARGNRQGGNRQGGNRGNQAQRMQGIAITILIVPADSDKDGSVSAKEWKAHLAALTTEDGGVDTERLGKNMPQMRRPGGRNRGGQQGGRQEPDAERMAQMRTRRVVRLFDTDRDGEVAVAEIRAWFAKLDKNQDGTIGKDELPQQQQQQRQARGPAPVAGQVAPDFELAWLGDKKKTVKLSSFQGNKPVALIFGSYT